MTIFDRISIQLNKLVKSNDAPRELRSLATEALVSLGWSDEEALQFANDNEEKIQNVSKRLINAAEDRAEPVSFEFNANDPFLIQGNCYVLPDEGVSTKDDKERRANAPELLKAIGDLNPRDFEHLCGVLLQCLAVDVPFVTQSSGDQGVDFFGKADFGKFVRGTSELGPVTENLAVWIVGQAKRYANTKVKTSDLRELVGSVELAKSRISADGGVALTDLEVRLCEPIFYFMVTSGVFTSGSETLLKSAGVAGFNGKRLSILLADHGVGLDSSRVFDRKIFLQTIKDMSSVVRDPNFA